MTTTQIRLVDFQKELTAIKEQFGKRYFADKVAVQKAAKIWGITCNDHGVALQIETEILYDKNGFLAKIYYAQSEKGYWNIGLDHATPISGGGYAPSVWDTVGFYSKEDARLFGVSKLQDSFARALNGDCPKKAELLNVIQHLKSERTPQLDLFCEVSP